MKRTHSWNKGVLLLSRFAGALLLAAFAVSCKQNVDTPKTETFSVTFSTNAKEYGTLTATLDDRPFTGGNVAAGKTVTFTAQANAGYEVERWTVNGTAVANNTTASYSRKITAKTDVKAFFKAAGNTRYTVRHLLEGLDGTYTKHDEEPKTGTTGKNTEAQPKTYTGFITPTVDQKPIKGDGSTVIEIKYARKEITLTFNLAGGAIDDESDPVVRKGKYEAPITKPAKPDRAGYTFSGWNPELPETFPAEDKTYTAQWAKLHPVTFSVEGTPPNGTLTATLDGKPFTGGDVAEGKTVEFTANDDEYAVGNWTVTPTAALIAGGQPGESTAKVKVTAATMVKVTFSSYKKVAFTALNTYLEKANAASDGIYYIEVTDLTASDVKGVNWSNPSPLGMILKSNESKKVALKLGAITGLTDMSWCFYRCTSLVQAPVIPSSVTYMSYCFNGCTSLTQAPVIPSSVTDMGGCFNGCTSLTQAPVIPSSVTYMSYCFNGCTSLTQAPVIPSSVANMSYCFYGCTSLTQAPVIPNSVTDMGYCFNGCTSLTQAPVIPSSVTYMGGCFNDCTSLTSVTLKCNYPSSKPNAFKDVFKDCSSLAANSIKVPAGQLQTYKDNASLMGTEPDRFIAE